MFIFRFPSSNGRATVSNSSNRAAGAAVVATKVVTTVVTVTMATGAMATSRADGVAMEAVVAVAIRMMPTRIGTKERLIMHISVKWKCVLYGVFVLPFTALKNDRNSGCLALVGKTNFCG